jgi:hypothetical protein
MLLRVGSEKLCGYPIDGFVGGFYFEADVV